MAIYGWVKHAAGMASWSASCAPPQMLSMALMPWADAAWASIILPLASPVQYTPGTTSPSSWPVRTLLLPFTAMNPRWASMPASSSPVPIVSGKRPVATNAAAMPLSAVYFHLSATGLQGFPLGHVPSYSYDFEEPLLYSLVFLLFSFNGAGPLSVDLVIYNAISMKTSNRE